MAYAFRQHCKNQPKYIKLSMLLINLMLVLGKLHLLFPKDLMYQNKMSIIMGIGPFHDNKMKCKNKYDHGRKLHLFMIELWKHPIVFSQFSIKGDPLWYMTLSRCCLMVCAVRKYLPVFPSFPHVSSSPLWLIKSHTVHVFQCEFSRAALRGLGGLGIVYFTPESLCQMFILPV